MPMRFVCPHCGASSTVADHFAGQSGPCGQCGKPITVPHMSQAGPPAVAASSSTWIVVVAVIAAVLVGVLMIGGMLAALLLPAIQSAREAARRAQCTNNERQILLGLLQYESINNRLPPAYSVDKDGKPLLSWRVLILPYLDQQSLYDQFHLDEPWDSPHNRPLAQRMPGVFRCPSDSNNKLNETSYVLIAGPGTAFDASKPGRSFDMPRGAGATILLAESSESGIVWTEPRDVDVKQLAAGLNATPGEGLRSSHPAIVVAGYADGHVESLEKSAEPRVLKQQVLLQP